MSQYSIPGFPTGLVDCRTYIENSSSVTSTVSSIVAAVKDTEEKYDTYTGLGWNGEAFHIFRVHSVRLRP